VLSRSRYGDISHLPRGEDRAGLQAERAARIQLVKRRANRSEPGNIKDLDQELTGHILSLPLGPAGGRERSQIVPKLIHPVRVEHLVFEGIDVNQLSERMRQLVRSASESGPTQQETPLTQAAASSALSGRCSRRNA